MSSLVECFSIIRDPRQESKDESRVRRDNASENFGVFRHVAINALRNEKTCKKGIKAKRFKATLQPDYVQKVLNGIF